jgi:hypothetical protein
MDAIDEGRRQHFFEIVHVEMEKIGNTRSRLVVKGSDRYQLKLQVLIPFRRFKRLCILGDEMQQSIRGRGPDNQETSRGNEEEREAAVKRVVNPPLRRESVR